MDVDELLKRAQQLIAEGVLLCGPHGVFAGYGGSETCSLCGQAIGNHEVIYKVDIRREGGVNTVCFHTICEITWRSEFERQQRCASAALSCATHTGHELTLTLSSGWLRLQPVI